MWPDQYQTWDLRLESDALPTALRHPATLGVSNNAKILEIGTPEIISVAVLIIEQPRFSKRCRLNA